MAFVQLSPSEFAGLSLEEKRAYQVQEADQFFQTAMAGGAISQSQRDFAERILLKRIPSAPTPSGFENTAKGIVDLSSSISTETAKGLWKTLAPVMVLGLVVLAILFIWKK